MARFILKPLKYLLAFLFFYRIVNFVRNFFLTPTFYDVFVCREKKYICVIAPYYSRDGFLHSICVVRFDTSEIVLQSKIVLDSYKDCLIVLYELPANISDHFEYVIKKGKRELYKRTYTKPETIPKYRLSISTLFKYEVDFLKEWLDYHKSVGVEHFYLYENNIRPDQNIAAVLAPYIKEGSVTHIMWPYPYAIYNYKLKAFWPNDAHAYTQLTQINHSLYKFSDETEWMLSCDVDEYFYSEEQKNLVAAVDTITEQTRTSSIRISGTWFGATAEEMVQAKSKGVVNTFIRSEKVPSSNAKCMLRAKEIDFAMVHTSVLNTYGQIGAAPPMLRFNHYRGISWKKRIDESFASEIENTELQKSMI